MTNYYSISLLDTLLYVPGSYHSKPILNVINQGWGAEAGCFWLLGAGAAWKKNRSWSRLEKKSGAGAAKKLAGSSALREDKKHKEIVL